MGLMVGLVEIAGRASLALIVAAAALAAGQTGLPRRLVLLALAPASLVLILLQVYAPPHYADRRELREDGLGPFAIAFETWVRFMLALVATWVKSTMPAPPHLGPDTRAGGGEASGTDVG